MLWSLKLGFIYRHLAFFSSSRQADNIYSFKEFRKNGGTVIRGSTECFFSIVDSRRVYAFCVENSPETMEKLGLVGAIGVVLLCGVCLGRALLFLSPPVVRR